MESLLLEMRSELKQISKSLEELKAENSLLRKEIFGIKNSSNSNSDDCVDLMKDETLRELVERIQFDVGKIKETIEIEKGDSNYDLVKLTRPGQNKNLFKSSAEPMEKYKPARIRTKDVEDQRLVDRWNELKLRGEIPLDGSTLTGTNLESISSSIELSENVSSSIVLIISNYLPLTIKSVSVFPFFGRRIRGPSDIKSQTKEVYSMEGEPFGCSFLYSFKISATLSLAVRCGTTADGGIILRAGFTPPDIPVDLSLSLALEKNSEFSTHCFWSGSDLLKDIGANCLITKGEYIAQVETTPGPQSIVQVEIRKERVQLPPIVDRMEGIINGRSVGGVTMVDYLSQCSSTVENVTLLPVACVVEIVNGLGVSLKNGRKFIRNTESEIFLPNQVLSYTREMFFAADESVVSGIFSYLIEETDLNIVIAFKCGDGGNNCFCATVGPLETELDENELAKLLNPAGTWETLESRKYAQAMDGEQFIVARNLHATCLHFLGSFKTSLIQVIKYHVPMNLELSKLN